MGDLLSMLRWGGAFLGTLGPRRCCVASAYLDTVVLLLILLEGLELVPVGLVESSGRIPSPWVQWGATGPGGLESTVFHLFGLLSSG